MKITATAFDEAHNHIHSKLKTTDSQLIENCSMDWQYILVRAAIDRASGDLLSYLIDRNIPFISIEITVQPL